MTVSDDRIAATEEAGRDEDHEQERDRQHQVDECASRTPSTRPPKNPANEPTITPIVTAMSVVPEPDQHRQPRAVDGQDEDAPTAVVGPERIGQGPRVLEPAGRVAAGLRDRLEVEPVVRPDDRPEDRQQDHHEDDDRADQGQPVALEPAPGDLPLVERLEGDLEVLGRTWQAALRLVDDVHRRAGRRDEDLGRLGVLAHPGSGISHTGSVDRRWRTRRRPAGSRTG